MLGLVMGWCRPVQSGPTWTCCSTTVPSAFRLGRKTPLNLGRGLRISDFLSSSSFYGLSMKLMRPLQPRLIGSHLHSSGLRSGPTQQLSSSGTAFVVFEGSGLLRRPLLPPSTSAFQEASWQTWAILSLSAWKSGAAQAPSAWVWVDSCTVSAQESQFWTLCK